MARWPTVSIRPRGRAAAPSRRSPASREQRADRAPRSPCTRPRRSARSAPDRARRRGTSPASTGCRTRSRCRTRCPGRPGSGSPWRPIARADVGGLALEGELRRVDADDRQALGAVALVPGLEVGQRAQAVDAGVRPEVDEHDAAAQPGHASAAREFSQRGCGGGELGRGAEHRQRRRAAARPAPAWPCAAARAIASTTASSSNFGLPRRPASSSSTAADFSRPPVGLVRNDGKWLASASWKRRSTLVNMSTAVSSMIAPKPRCRTPLAAGAPHAVDQPPPAEREAEQHDRRAEAVGDRDGDDLRRRARRRADGDDRGEDRPGARRVDEAQRAADRQARPEAVGVAARAPGAAGTTGAASATRAARGTSSVIPNSARNAIATVRSVPSPTPTPSTTEATPTIVITCVSVSPVDDPDRPAPPAGAARRQQRGQDRQHAGRDRGGRAGEEREGEQEDHG